MICGGGGDVGRYGIPHSEWQGVCGDVLLHTCGVWVVQPASVVWVWMVRLVPS